MAYRWRSPKPLPTVGPHAEHRGRPAEVQQQSGHPAALAGALRQDLPWLPGVRREARHHRAAGGDRANGMDHPSRSAGVPVAALPHRRTRGHDGEIPNCLPGGGRQHELGLVQGGRFSTTAPAEHPHQPRAGLSPGEPHRHCWACRSAELSVPVAGTVPAHVRAPRRRGRVRHLGLYPASGGTRSSRPASSGSLSPRTRGGSSISRPPPSRRAGIGGRRRRAHRGQRAGGRPGAPRSAAPIVGDFNGGPEKFPTFDTLGVAAGPTASTTWWPGGGASTVLVGDAFVGTDVALPHPEPNPDGDGAPRDVAWSITAPVRRSRSPTTPPVARSRASPERRVRRSASGRRSPLGVGGVRARGTPGGCASTTRSTRFGLGTSSSWPSDSARRRSRCRGTGRIPDRWPADDGPARPVAPAAGLRPNPRSMNLSRTLSFGAPPGRSRASRTARMSAGNGSAAVTTWSPACMRDGAAAAQGGDQLLDLTSRWWCSRPGGDGEGSDTMAQVDLDRVSLWRASAPGPGTFSCPPAPIGGGPAASLPASPSCAYDFRVAPSRLTDIAPRTGRTCRSAPPTTLLRVRFPSLQPRAAVQQLVHRCLRHGLRPSSTWLRSRVRTRSAHPGLLALEVR